MRRKRQASVGLDIKVMADLGIDSWSHASPCKLTQRARVQRPKGTDQYGVAREWGGASVWLAHGGVRKERQDWQGCKGQIPKRLMSWAEESGPE